VSDKFRVGQVVTGTLEKKEKFGYFISLAPGITGLLPKSKISASEKPAAIEGLKVGDPLAVTVEAIRLLERKISLAPGDATDEGAWKNFAQAAPHEPVGDLAEKLRKAMAAKNNK
jgi:small subunit ribosomal protein S1